MGYFISLSMINKIEDHVYENWEYTSTWNLLDRLN